MGNHEARVKTSLTDKEVGEPQIQYCEFMEGTAVGHTHTHTPPAFSQAQQRVPDYDWDSQTFAIGIGLQPWTGQVVVYQALNAPLTDGSQL